MILNMLRSEALSAEEMMKNSFSADGHQKTVHQQRKLLVEVLVGSIQNSIVIFWKLTDYFILIT